MNIVSDAPKVENLKDWSLTQVILYSLRDSKMQYANLFNMVFNLVFSLILLSGGATVSVWTAVAFTLGLIAFVMRVVEIDKQLNNPTNRATIQNGGSISD